MDSNKGSYRNCLFKDSARADIVTLCLTDDCKDCTGSYSNEILGHRWICECLCHRKGVSRVPKRRYDDTRAGTMQWRLS